MASIRTFIAIEIPKDIRNQIAKLQSGVKGLGGKITWVKPENMHLTLKFLGDTAKDTGISLEDVSWAECPVSKKEEQIAKQYNVKLQVSGSYFSFKNFLFVLEHTARLVEVSKISFDTPLDEDESISYNLELRIYSY